MLLAMMLITSIGLSTVACTSSKKDKKKKDKKIEREDDDDEDDEDDDDEDDDDDKPSKPGSFNVSGSATGYTPGSDNGIPADDKHFIGDHPSGNKAVTAELLGGGWVDEDGVCIFYSEEDNAIYDYLGNSYTISSFEDDGVYLSSSYALFDMSLFENTALIGTPQQFFLPIYMYDDYLLIGNMKLYRDTSDEGTKLLDALYDDLMGKEFDMYDMTFVYRDDGTMDYGMPNYEYTYENGRFYPVSTVSGSTYLEDNEFYFYLRRINSDAIFMFVPEMLTTISMYGKDCSSGSDLFDTYILADVSGDVAEYSYFEMAPNDKGTIDEISMPLDDFSNVTTETSDVIYDTYAYLNQIKYNDIDCCVLVSSFTVFADLDADRNGGNGLIAALYRTDTIAAQVLLYRQDIVSNGAENIIIPDTYVYETDGIKIEIATDSDVLWACDVVNCEFVGEDDMYYEFYRPYDAPFEVIGPFFTVRVAPGVSYTISAEVSIESEEDAENIVLVSAGDYYDLGNFGRIHEFNDADVTSDKMSFTYESSDTSSYVIGNQTEYNASIQAYNAQTILEIDPYDSLYAMNNETGDILSLVDLDYIADSIVSDDGSAIFWVSTPEELASVTYYVNAMDLDPNDTSRMYYIHLLNDIDLDGYIWAPIGAEMTYDYTSAVQSYHMFQGVIFGNGYSIKNMTLNYSFDSAFVSDCHLTTIIGLTIENPQFIDNTHDYIEVGLVNNSCICEVIDCTVIIDEDKKDNFQFGDPYNASVSYIDCDCYFVNDATGKLLELELPYDANTEFYNGYDNWLKRYYQNDDGSYSYDAAKEYSAYQKDPQPFIDSFYYMDDGVERIAGTGYLDFIGWLHGDDFYVNYGSVRDDINYFEAD